MLKNIVSGLMELFFPSRCPSCNSYTENQQWCEQCFADLVLMENLTYHEEVRQYISPIFALGKYNKGLQNLIHELKYQGKRDWQPYLAPFLNLLADEFDFSAFDVIIPVPLHQKKLKERGYNQVDLIFKDWCIQQGYNYKNLLLRQRYTEKQHLLNYEQRQINLQEAFTMADNTQVKGLRCLLVDDIFTTGSTLRHCGQVLLAAGASSVSGLVLASNANE